VEAVRDALRSAQMYLGRELAGGRRAVRKNKE
jgi:hypothetical protein